MSDIPSVQSDLMDSNGSQNNIMPETTTSSGKTNTKRSQQNRSGKTLPIKKRKVAAVTKCTKCNGSGVIYICGQKPAKAGQQEQQKSYQCNICGDSFSRYTSLWSHKKLHTGEKKYKCSICGLAFAKAENLQNHSRIHTGEKPFICATCGIQFAQAGHLRNHERTHSGEKPYVCQICGKAYAQYGTLWNHKRIHTGERPYKCNICGSAFIRAAHLQTHVKVHLGEKRFKCDSCSAAFGNRYKLRKHREIHEKNGEIAPTQPAKVPMEEEIVHKQELPEIKVEVTENVDEVIISG